jgi:hypothetical protein
MKHLRLKGMLTYFTQFVPFAFWQPQEHVGQFTIVSL